MPGLWVHPMSQIPSLLVLTDLRGQPSVRITLPGPLRIGDPIRLSFKLRRKLPQGRHEELNVQGEVRVSRIGIDTTRGAGCLQVVSAEWIGPPPSWKAIKRPLGRTLPPARAPRTPVR